MTITSLYNDGNNLQTITVQLVRKYPPNHKQYARLLSAYQLYRAAQQTADRTQSSSHHAKYAKMADRATQQFLTLLDQETNPDNYLLKTIP